MNGPEAFPLFGILQGFQSECTEAVKPGRGLLCLSFAYFSVNYQRFKNKQTKTWFILFVYKQRLSQAHLEIKSIKWAEINWIFPPLNILINCLTLS